MSVKRFVSPGSVLLLLLLTSLAIEAQTSQAQTSQAQTSTPDQDKARVEAEKLMETGKKLLETPGVDAAAQAAQKFEQALPLWRAAKHNAGEARAYYLMGQAFEALGQYQKEEEAAERGLPLARAANDQGTEAYLLDTIGNAYSGRGENKKALEYFLKALSLRSEKEPVGLANTLNNVGTAYGWIGDYPKALTYFERAVPLLHDQGDRRKESDVLGNMCVIHKSLDENTKALELCKQAVTIKREVGDKSGEGTTLSNTGNVYAALDDYQTAIEYYLQARALYTSLGEKEGEAVTLNNIGWAHATLGDREKAIDFYNQALKPLRVLGNKYSIAVALSNIGVNYAELKDYRKALEIHLEVLSMRPESDDREGRAITLNHIAVCYQNLGDKAKALEYFTQAIALHRSIGNKRQLASSLRNIGGLYRDQGEYEKAMEYFKESRAISVAVADRNGEASVLAGIAKLELARGNLIEARKLVEEAISAVESFRGNLKSQQLRATFLASVRKYYELNVDVLMRLHQQRPTEGFAEAALQVSERSRARSLLELLREARAEIRQGVDPALIQREKDLRGTIADKAQQQTRMLSGNHAEEQVAAASKEIAALTTEYEEVQGRIRKTSPRYAALVEPPPITVAAIQKQVVDENTLLLEYALGEEKSYVWAVTPDSVKSFELPGRATIEAAAKRVYELLNESSTPVPAPTVAQQKNHADVEYPAAADALSRLLLAPVATELKNKRLVIVAEGILQYVPFSTLPSPGADSSRPLIVDHEILNLPSASVLALLREDAAQRKPAAKAVAVLADPVFSANDSRLTHKVSADEESLLTRDAQRSAAESGLDSLIRLRFSRLEADEIARLAGDKRNLKAVDFSANRSMVMDEKLSDYRIVHFATHGLINNQHPDLSGIVLSLVDEQGRPQNGFLRLYDIYNLKLNADLVVLSACQTALGKQINGEGLVGLTRGFMYAGAPRVVASLWRIDDRATAEMMRRFYQGMLKDGLRPAAALRAAQVSMLSEKRWQSPHYWAAFTLQGEWR